jgi:hypothetical protein
MSQKIGRLYQSVRYCRIPQGELISTSFDKKLAKTFMSPDAEDRSVLLTLMLSKGTRGLYVQTISQFEEERELLLPHRTRFKVIKRTHVMHGGRRCVNYVYRMSSQPKEIARMEPPSKYIQQLCNTGASELNILLHERVQSE